MAKGDDKRVRNAIDESQGYLGARNDNLRFGAIEPNFNNAFNERLTDRASDKADYSKLQGGFDEFAKTGGFSPEDISDFRARAAAPIRAGYGNAVREVDRSRALSGGSMPGYAVLRSRMNRDMNQGMSDANINANAAIAQMVQQGKMAGLQGGSQLYGTTPAWSNMASNNLSGATGQALQLHDIDSRNRLGLLQNRNAAAGIPGKWESTLGTLGGFVKNVGQGVAGAAAPWSGGA